MIPLRSSLRIRYSGRDTLLIRTAPGRRLTFLAASLVLLGAFASGFDPAADFGDGRLAGTILFFVLFAACLTAAAMSRIITVDRRGGEIVFGTAYVTRSIGPTKRIALDRVERFVSWSVVLYRGREAGSGPPQTALDRYRKYVEVRSRLFRLYLEAEERRIMITESSYAEEIESIAEALSSFTGKRLDHEEG